MSAGSAPDDRALLERTVGEIMADHCPPEVVAAAEGSWDEPLWAALVEAGMSAVGVPEHLGGSGGEPADAAAVLRVVAAHAGPVPLAEALFPVAAGCAMSGLAFPEGPSTVAVGPGLTMRRTGAGVVLDGTAPRVPYARFATRILVAGDGGGHHPELVALLDPTHLTLATGDNLAGEPRDDLVAARSEIPTDDVAEVPEGTAAQLYRLGRWPGRCSLPARWARSWS